jgi:hypothetical protein
VQALNGKVLNFRAFPNKQKGRETRPKPSSRPGKAQFVQGALATKA